MPPSWAFYRDEGLVHRGRGRLSNHATDGEVKKRILRRYEERHLSAALHQFGKLCFQPLQILRDARPLPRPGSTVTVARWRDGSIHLLVKGKDIHYE